jgi:hypothetical protein
MNEPNVSEVILQYGYSINMEEERMDFECIIYEKGLSVVDARIILKGSNTEKPKPN